MSLFSKYFIKMCTKSDTARDAGLTTPPEIERFNDIQYGSDPKWHLLDVYRPKAQSGKLPVIVSFHGGGWVYGNKEVYQFYCMDLAKRGFAVVNYTYRLAPNFRHPAPIEDTNLVFGWLLENAEKYGFDTDNIFAVGDSAGATGIAVYACILTNKDYAENYSFTAPEGLKIKALGLNCGIYNISENDNFKLWYDYLPRHKFSEYKEQLCVRDIVTADFPPSYIMAANMDELNVQSPLLAEKLEQLGVKYVYKVYGDEKAPVYHVFHCNIRSPEAAVCNDEECAFFREYIK
ncbi:MAG: alpha/beta hydrolase [Ruminococcus sp.]|uniref:alpha/beta hydrolase n=1 Tax=Ruminococcus sp. TaxID=41978 RepID=UPI0025CE2053|nr:alpha/beta hydrolase [Ruminococcus sp.]MCR4795568.1 alpha/beta hydrolase [Ruminococcus sp.]